MPFVAMPFPSKVIARLSGDIRFTEGQHSITTPEGEGAQAEAAGMIVRHLTLPARDDLAGKREHGLRRIAAGFASEIGWQLQRLAFMTDGELDDYWDNNSWRLADHQRVLVGAYDRLLEDDALVEIGRGVRAAVDHLGVSPHARADETATVDIGPKRLERLLGSLVDDWGATDAAADRILQERTHRLAALQAELDERSARVTRLQQELADVEAEHARALEVIENVEAEHARALEVIERSASWRVTAPLRTIRRGLRG
jgi:hypothetical protein